MINDGVEQKLRQLTEEQQLLEKQHRRAAERADQLAQQLNTVRTLRRTLLHELLSRS